MSQATINLDSNFTYILGADDFDNFTVLEFRAAFMALPNHRHLSKDLAHRVIYRKILRLQKRGLLRRVDSKTTKTSRYQKTALFFSAEFLSRADEFLSSAELKELTAPASNEELMNGDDHVIKHLVEKLKQYELALLSSMGESDEYKALSSDFPQLKSQLQEGYNKARDNSSKLLGRVKAIETLIEQQKTT